MLNCKYETCLQSSDFSRANHFIALKEIKHRYKKKKKEFSLLCLLKTGALAIPMESYSK